MSKIVFTCAKGNERFLKDIVAATSRRHEVSCCYSAKLSELLDAVAPAEIVWLEWADAIAVELTNRPGCLDGKRQVMLRLHSYEAFSNSLNLIDWRKITDLVFVAPHIASLCESRHPGLLKLPKRVHIIPNGVDLSRFNIPAGKAASKKLAFLGTVDFKKGPMLLLHAFHALVQAGGDFTLHIGGPLTEPRYPLYFKQVGAALGLLDKISLDGPVSDVPGWLKDKSHIVCSSLLESQHMAVMEGMACGLKPLVHNFIGAGCIYPKEWIWTGIPDFVRLAKEEPLQPELYRDFVAVNYSLEGSLSATLRLFL